MEETKKNANFYLSLNVLGLLEDMVYVERKKQSQKRMNKSIFIEGLIRQEAERRKAK